MEKELTLENLKERVDTLPRVHKDNRRSYNKEIIKDIKDFTKKSSYKTTEVLRELNITQSVYYGWSSKIINQELSEEFIKRIEKLKKEIKKTTVIEGNRKIYSIHTRIKVIELIEEYNHITSKRIGLLLDIKDTTLNNWRSRLRKKGMLKKPIIKKPISKKTDNPSESIKKDHQPTISANINGNKITFSNNCLVIEGDMAELVAKDLYFKLLKEI